MAVTTSSSLDFLVFFFFLFFLSSLVWKLIPRSEFEEDDREDCLCFFSVFSIFLAIFFILSVFFLRSFLSFLSSLLPPSRSNLSVSSFVIFIASLMTFSPC